MKLPHVMISAIASVATMAILSAPVVKAQWTMPSFTLTCYVYNLGYNIDLQSVPSCSSGVNGYTFRRTFIATAKCIDCRDPSKVAFPTTTVTATAGMIEPCPNWVTVIFSGATQAGTPPYVYASLQASANGFEPYLAQTSQDCNLQIGSVGTGVDLPCGVYID